MALSCMFLFVLSSSTSRVTCLGIPYMNHIHLGRRVLSSPFPLRAAATCDRRRTARSMTTTSLRSGAAMDFLEAKDEEESVRRAKPKLIILAGPTGIGKSDVAARLGNTIIVSADSVQAYPGVLVGANKPTPEERLETPHILVDVVGNDVNAPYTSADWRRDALYAIQKLMVLDEKHSLLTPSDIEEIDDYGRERLRRIDDDISAARKIRGFSDDQPVVPVIVGGTMMYVQWLVQGRPDAMRPTESAVQKAIDMVNQYDQDNIDDWNKAVSHVKSMGEKFDRQVSKLCYRDWYRLRRIMEVVYTVQEMIQKQDKHAEPMDSILERLYSGQFEGGLMSLAGEDAIDMRCFFLCPDNRWGLSKIVDERCEQMVMKGLIRETTDLSLQGALPDMVARAIGYRQTLEYLSRDDPQDKDAPAFFRYLEAFTAATRQYSKRQMQWYRRDPKFVFVPVCLSEQNKQKRVEALAKEIQRMVDMPRTEFDEKERLNEQSDSAKARKLNEEQGQDKGMKRYQYQTKVFPPNTRNLLQTLQEADLCTHQFQSSKTNEKSSPEKKRKTEVQS